MFARHYADASANGGAIACGPNQFYFDPILFIAALKQFFGFLKKRRNLRGFSNVAAFGDGLLRKSFGGNKNCQQREDLPKAWPIPGAF
jgi:hypothetical protein